MATNKKCTKPYTDRDKWIVSVISAILFLVIASPFLYSITNMLTSSIGLTIATDKGCPYVSGLIIHAILFGLIIRLLML